jgi:acetyltransferase-like isoleucine patch superfamily enzyme
MLKKLFGSKRKRKQKTSSLAERFQIGRGTYGEPTVLDWESPAKLRMGAYCSIGDKVTILLGGNHRIDWVTTYPFMEFRESAEHIQGHPQTKGDVVIGNDVWIGYGASILSGVNIGNGAVIGAFAVVASNVPAYGIVAGNPAKLIRKRFPDSDIELLEKLAWWDWPEAMLDEAMPLILSSNLAGLADFAAKRRA